MKNHQAPGTYDRLALSDGDSSQNYYRHAGPDMRLKTVLRLAQKIKPRRILEIGCSDGHVMGSLKGALPKSPGGSIFGLDISKISLQRAKDKGFGNVALGRAEDLSFTPDSFDLVIASQVLEHIGDIERTLDQAFSTIKPGGFFIITVPLADWFKLYKGLIRKVPVKYLDQETHIREWSLIPFQGFASKDGLLSQLKKSGFIVRHSCGSFFYSWRLERLADNILLQNSALYDLLRAWDAILGSTPVLRWLARYAVVVSQKPII